MTQPDIRPVDISRARRNRLLSVDDIRQMPRPEPLIQDVLFSNMEHVIFGPQGSTKTYIIIDQSLHIAVGRRWMGKQVESGRVIYVCGEGGGRVLADRVDAWMKYHEIGDDSAVIENFLITEYPVAMLDGESVMELLSMIEEAGGADLIVIDTLAANFGGGDENSQSDMSRFCGAIRELRLKTKAGVVVVHHTGHADKTRPQGANILRRNPDIELRVDRDVTDDSLFGLMGGGDLKSRHGKGCGLIPYRLKSVSLDDCDRFGKRVSSAVVVPTQDTPTFVGQTPGSAKLGANQSAVIQVLRDIARDTGQDEHDPEGVYIASDRFLQGYRAAGLNKGQAYRVRKTFAERGWIVESTGGFKWFSV